jgi:hypothetical protein
MEPIIVIESDDWGMKRTPCVELLQQFGEPAEWAEESMETPDDLDDLFSALASVRDCFGRPACFTANFILENPDFEALERTGFQKWYGVPVYKDERLMSKYQEGRKKELFYPQLHGRSHIWTEGWLEDIRAGEPCATTLAKARITGGRIFLKGDLWRYHSEYCHWQSGLHPGVAKLTEAVRDAQALFNETFGFDSLSTIPPHYIRAEGFAEACRKAGIHYVQGGNYGHVMRITGGRASSLNYLGEPWKSGIYFLHRTARLEPRPQRPPAHGVKAATERLRDCFAQHIPVVLDTHRINYTGKFAADGLKSLREFLQAASEFSPRYLTTVELGEAIVSRGSYVDSFTHDTRQLTLLDEVKGRVARSVLRLRETW